MFRRTSLAAATLAFAIAGAAFGQETPPAPAVEKPSPEAVKSFWSFYFNGQGQGFVLADAKLCLEVPKEGPSKFECAKEATAGDVKPGTILLVWQAYLVPQGDSIEDIIVQLKLGDQIRETKDVKISGGNIRSRQWTPVRIPKAGNWTITIMRGSETLKSMEVVSK